MLLSIKLIIIITKNDSNHISVAGGISNLQIKAVLRKNWQNWYRNSHRGDCERNLHPVFPMETQIVEMETQNFGKKKH